MTSVTVYEATSPEGVSTIFATRKRAVEFSGTQRGIVPRILHFDYLEEHGTGRRIMGNDHAADVLADAERLNLLQSMADDGVVSICFDIDGGYHVTLDHVDGTRPAARNVNSIREGIDWHASRAKEGAK